jgi:hypothetical protein
VTPAAPHTDTAPNTPPSLNPRSIPTRPTPRTRPRATRPPMRRCPNQRHIRARPPTQIMYRIRRHRPTAPRTGAPGPKLLTTRTNRWDIPCMSTRASGGPPGVLGLLDHETQIRPRAHKNHPTSGKRSGTANFHDRNGAAATLAMPRPHQFVSGTGHIHHHGCARSRRRGRNRSHTHPLPGEPSWPALTKPLLTDPNPPCHHRTRSHLCINRVLPGPRQSVTHSNTPNWTGQLHHQSSLRRARPSSSRSVIHAVRIRLTERDVMNIGGGHWHRITSHASRWAPWPGKWVRSRLCGARQLLRFRIDHSLPTPHALSKPNLRSGLHDVVTLPDAPGVSRDRIAT